MYFVPNRLLDDDGAAFLKFENGAKGVLIATQIAAGEENAIRIRVYGEKGGLEWLQHEPNTLIVKWVNQPTQIYRTGTAWMNEAAVANTRVPGGHPEGYLEAFANIYRNFAYTLHGQDRRQGTQTRMARLSWCGRRNPRNAVYRPCSRIGLRQYQKMV
jgi:predicted dehydrogenase